MRRSVWLAVIWIVGLVAWAVGAQDILTPITLPANESIQITFPPPVYVLRGSVDIRGTADAMDMANYFLEFRPLVVDDPTTEADESDETTKPRPWFPATLPAVNAVQEGVLGSWNTVTAPDGLYELRLTVNINRGDPQYFRVSPLRIENNPPDFVDTIPTISPPAGQPPARPTLIPTPTALPGGAPAQPTPRPSATGLAPTSPLAIAVTNANVRLGDSTIYPRVGALQVGESVPIIGISSLGSGWYYVQLPNGTRGFVAPSVVRTEGNLSGLTPIVPPEPPAAPPTFTPFVTPVVGATQPTTAATPAPGTGGTVNLVISGFRLEPAQPRCSETFQIFINVTNTGTGTPATGFSVAVVDRHTASGTTAGSTTATVPPIAPGGNFVSVLNLTVNTFFDESHTITALVDSGGAVAETNEGDNTSAVSYTLATAGC